MNKNYELMLDGHPTKRIQIGKCSWVGENVEIARFWKDMGFSVELKQMPIGYTQDARKTQARGNG
jgi:hypothetical protein